VPLSRLFIFFAAYYQVHVEKLWLHMCATVAWFDGLEWTVPKLQRCISLHWKNSPVVLTQYCNNHLQIPNFKITHHLVSCLIASWVTFFHAFLSYASWIRVVGLLPNCCRNVCRCLPRALFPGINPVRDRCSNFSCLITWPKNFIYLILIDFNNLVLWLIYLFCSPWNSVHTPKAPYLECLNSWFHGFEYIPWFWALSKYWINVAIEYKKAWFECQILVTENWFHFLESWFCLSKSYVHFFILSTIPW